MGSFLVVLLAMFVFVYLLLIRPQRTQQRRHAELMDNLKPGDEVITVGGIYGDVVCVESDRVHLEIAEDVEIEVAKRAIASVVPPEVESEVEEDTTGEPDEPHEPHEDAQAELEAAQAEAEAETEAAVQQEDTARR
jgi:preprotein translocase subunit YajC